MFAKRFTVFPDASADMSAAWVETLKILQLLAPETDEDPDAQLVHAVVEVVAEYWPAAQLMHAVEPTPP